MNEENAELILIRITGVDQLQLQIFCLAMM